MLALALIAIGSGGFAGLAATAVAVTVAATVCVISALLSVRLAFGPKLTSEPASWIALAASIAGLVFTATVANMGRHEPVRRCRVPVGRVDGESPWPA
jgi:hypothetical protein